ncbi:MAG: hypothetical protein OXC38_01005, partial [Gammaproteobacteria bacterium]|nr:hypothetical protein [Gammaproteobacteria bacterium]
MLSDLVGCGCRVRLCTPLGLADRQVEAGKAGVSTGRGDAHAKRRKTRWWQGSPPQVNAIAPPPPIFRLSADCMRGLKRASKGQFGLHRPVPSADAARPDARTGRRHARFSPVPVLLFGALCLFNTAPAEAQTEHRASYPAKPQNVQVTPGPGKLTLTWEAPSSWGDYPRDRYEINWRVGDDGDFVTVGPDGIPDPDDAVNSYTFEGTYGSTTVTNGIKYCLEIRAVSKREDPSDPDVPGFWVEVCGTPVAAPTVSLALSPASITEDGGISTVTASLSGALSAAVTVTVSARANSPATNSDFTQAGTTLTIAAGSTASTGTVTITAVDNDVDAPNKTVTVSGTASGGGVASLTVTGATLTITDDETTPTVSLALGSSSISENGGSSTVTASLSGASSAAVTVTVSAQANGPATNSDFTQAGTTLTIAAGSTASTGTVTITAVDNDVDAPNKTVTVS